MTGYKRAKTKANPLLAAGSEANSVNTLKSDGGLQFPTTSVRGRPSQPFRLALRLAQLWCRLFKRTLLTVIRDSSYSLKISLAFCNSHLNFGFLL